MAVITAKSVFIHIPKTGGSWVTTTLEALSIKHPGSFTKHANLKIKGKKTFAFIRNPVTWYQSRWADPWHRRFFKRKTSGGKLSIELWSRPAQILHKTAAKNKEEYEDFNTWLNNNLQLGWLTEYYKLYLGKKYKKIDYIGKNENLVSDLLNILDKIGEEYNEDSIRNTPIVNESDPSLNKKYTLNNLKLVIESERKFMEEFGYSTKISEYDYLLL